MDKQNSQRIMAMLHARSGALDNGEPISPPIVTTAKYALAGTPDTPYTYGRDINPTVEATEAAIAALEEAPVVAFPSGMAAITAALMITAKAGDHVLVPSDGYYVTRVMLEEILSGHDIQFDAIPTRDFAAADLSKYAVIWVETPSNPGLDLCSIRSVSEAAKAVDATVVVDNTTLTPLLQRPLDLGADLVVSSDTKAMAGHSDCLYGHVATRDEALFQKVWKWRKVSGSIPDPFPSFLVHRGLMTLELRLERMCTTARALVDRIGDHPAIETIKYPGMGFVIGLTFSGEARAERFINSCPAIFASTSFGGVHTSAERRARWADNVAEGFVRLSVGCEPTEALISAIEATLAEL
ncbi:MAG: PLP-dependent transferase [Hyphomonadaceae bacterium]|nr:PLP-dependent transferase [Hyphomonadaceae bacterium]